MGKQTVCGRNANKVAWQLNPDKDFLKKKKIFQEFTNFPPFFGFFFWARLFFTVCSAFSSKKYQGYLLASKAIKPLSFRVVKEVGILFK